MSTGLAQVRVHSAAMRMAWGDMKTLVQLGQARRRTGR